MTVLRVGWDAKQDALRKYWRIYLSERESDKGKLVAEVNGYDTGHVIRDVSEGKKWVRVLAVNTAGTETDWKSGPVKASTGTIVVNRKRQAPSTTNNAGAAPVVNELGMNVVLDPPDLNDPPQSVEVIAGSDPDLGQTVSVVPVERGSETGEGGARGVRASVPTLPGRTATRRVVAIRGVTKGAKHAGTVTTVPITTIDYPNHDATVLGSVVTATLTNVVAADSTNRWESGSYGVRTRANPPSTDWLGGWGLSGSGTLASEPSGAYRMTAATITISTYDLGSSKVFWLECYDEAQTDPDNLPFDVVESRNLIQPSGPIEIENLDGGERNNNWALYTTRSNGKPRRPLPPTRWQYRYGDSEPLGDWLEYVPGVRGNARYIQARMILAQPSGFNRVLVPYAYVRAWTPHDQAPVSNTQPHKGVLSPVGRAYMGLAEGTDPQNISTAAVTVVAYAGVPTTNYISASTTTGVFTVKYAGAYDIDFAASFSGSNPGMTIECYLWINTTEQAAEFHRSIGTANAIGSASFGMQADLAAGDAVFVKVESDTDSRSWTPEALTFKMKRVE